MQDETSVPSIHAGIELVATDATNDDVGQPKVVFHVSNEREQAVRILTWNTPLEKELSADVFEVVLNGLPVEYQGRMVKRGTPQESDFIELPAGGRVETVVDIGRYYDISQPGIYTLSYKPYLVDGVEQLNQKTPVMMDEDTLTFSIGD